MLKQPVDAGRDGDAGLSGLINAGRETQDPVIGRPVAAWRPVRRDEPDRVADRQDVQAKASPAFGDLEVWLAQQLTRISGKSPLAAAIRYAMARMERMRPYLAYGILELDNNIAERGMRAIDLGRKN